MSKVIVVGSGNAALCAGIAALEVGAEVLIIEKASIEEMGGNSRYTAGAMRFVYNTNEDLLPLLLDPEDPKISKTEFGSYTKEKFQKDLLGFNEGRPLSLHQNILIDKSYETMVWLGSHNIRFEPIYSRQMFEKDGIYIFWGGLTLEAHGEGVGLVDAEIKEFKRLGGEIQYNTEAIELIKNDTCVKAIKCRADNLEVDLFADAIVLGCGGFEANPALRKKYIGDQWEKSLVRGTRHNMGQGLEMALVAGAQFHGVSDGCHAVPMDKNMPNYGNLEIPYIDRKHYRKICYFLGVMINAEGERFLDEGINFRNYTYAQFGKALLNQPEGFAYQVFDAKVEELLYSEYRFWDASFIESDTLEGLVDQMKGVNKESALQTLLSYNQAVDDAISFDPTILDGKRTNGLTVDKTNWANKINTAPFKAYPVSCGITFTYAGVKVDKNAAVVDQNGRPISGLYACGEMIGGVFYNGYPGGSGLTSGSVFGRIAGYAAANR